MAEFIESDQFRELFVSGAPLIDVRAPIEFLRGTVPGSVNLPLLEDDERSQVGTTYRYEGKDAAIGLGYQLVSGPERERRVTRWAECVREQAPAALYCARGGLRSKITQEWLEFAGVSLPRVSGGYKALRNFLISAIEEETERNSFLVVSGKTGSGKTKLLNLLASSRAVVDLEGLAKHRGSAFGKVYGEQPTQATFENALGVDLLRHSSAEPREIILESESRRIGYVELPQPIFRKMANSPVVTLDVSFDERVTNIVNDYVEDVSGRFVAAHGVGQGFQLFEEFLVSSVMKNEQRLGNERTRQILSLIQQAIAAQSSTGVLTPHRAWIEIVLRDYYDPFYTRHLESYRERIVFRGDFHQVFEYLRGKS